MSMKFSSMFKVLYVGLLIFLFLYVKNTLSEDVMEVTSEKEREDGQYIEELSPILEVHVNDKVRTYKTKVKNTDTIEDFISDVRDTSNLYYEKELYTYGSEIESVYDQKAEDGKKWGLWNLGQDVTHQISDLRVTTTAPYILKQTEIIHI